MILQLAASEIQQVTGKTSFDGVNFSERRRIAGTILRNLRGDPNSIEIAKQLERNSVNFNTFQIINDLGN